MGASDHQEEDQPWQREGPGVQTNGAPGPHGHGRQARSARKDRAGEREDGRVQKEAREPRSGVYQTGFYRPEDEGELGQREGIIDFRSFKIDYLKIGRGIGDPLLALLSLGLIFLR